jgi:hypothetical protein
MLASLVISLLLASCATPWKRSFEPVAEGVYAPTDRVIIRRVPWERLNGALGAIEQDRAASDTHPAEWPIEKRREEHARLVQALQLSEEPDRVIILGRSVFRSTGNVEIMDGSLSAFARSIGADYAIWSSTFIGRAQTVEQETITRHGHTYARRRTRDGHIDYDFIPFHETIYVPVVVERDEHAWLVFYARIVNPDEP